jgi:hypothetical protein
LEKLRQEKREGLITFLQRHIEKLGRGKPLQLKMRFWGRGAKDVVWRVEWRDGRLGIVGKGGVVDDEMAERYTIVRRHFDSLSVRGRNGEVFRRGVRELGGHAYRPFATGYIQSYVRLQLVVELAVERQTDGL